MAKNNKKINKIMESRQITINQSATQEIRTVNTAATTLGELKAALDAENISYRDMSFYEAISRNEMTDNAAQLPRDVSYKGVITNNLVFVLSPLAKKIKSGGISNNLRAQVEDYITTHNLMSAVYMRFNRSYQNVPTADLVAYIDSLIVQDEPQEVPSSNTPSNSWSEGFFELLYILQEAHVIDSNDVDRIEAAMQNVSNMDTPSSKHDSVYDDRELMTLCNGR